MDNPGEALARKLDLFASDLLAPLACDSPAYGYPGRAHCAACCYGTGLVITNEADQAIVDAADALQRAARLVRAG